MPLQNPHFFGSITVRDGVIDEISKLNDFIRRSKAHWGYSDEFLNQFIASWGLSLPTFNDLKTFVFESNNTVIALLTFSFTHSEPELSDLFVDPDYIGCGLGRYVWEHAVSYAKSTQLESFFLIADPNAENFYLKMGARCFDQVETFPGRFVPKMRYTLCLSEP